MKYEEFICKNINTDTIIKTFDYQHKLPKSYDLRSKMSSLSNNNIVGSIANAIATLIEYDIPNFTCSRLFLYYNERTISSEYNLNNSIISLKKYGICNETDWKYDINNINVKPPKECYENALSNYKFDLYKINTDLKSMKLSLINNEPFIISIKIFKSFEDNIGVLSLPLINEEVIGCITIVICGYDDTKQCFIARYLYDYLYIPYLYLINYDICSDAWILVIRYYNIIINKIPSENINLKQIEITNKINEIDYLDLSTKLGKVYDQGNIGSCTANALCTIFNYDIPNFSGSRLFLYYNERLLIDSVDIDSGAYISDGIECLKKYGICNENEWKYIISNYKIKPPDNCYINAKKHYTVEAFNIENNLDIIKTCIINNEPIVLGIALYESFNDIKKDGICKMPNENENYLGGHAVVLCGFDDKNKRFILRNSWGSYWGNNGNFYLPYEYILNDDLTTDLWIITKSISI